MEARRMDHGHLHIDRTTGEIEPASKEVASAYRRAQLTADHGGDMPISVYIPTPFRRLTGNRQHVLVEGGNVGEVLANVEAQYPGFRSMIFGSGEELPAHINIYVNKQEIGSLDGIETKVSDGDEVAVIPAMAGGSNDGAADAVEPIRRRVGALTPDQVTRYSRHIIMPQDGPSGQRKIMESSVLII